jgi:flagellar biogenesis protein FliO
VAVAVLSVLVGPLSTFLATGQSGVPLVVWQAVGGLVGVLLIFGLLVYIVQRFVVLGRRPDSDGVSRASKK